MRTITIVDRNWIRWIRLTSRNPIWKIVSGKNSEMDGPWNSSGAFSAAVAIRVAA
jgi:hypothetical protein